MCKGSRVTSLPPTPLQVMGLLRERGLPRARAPAPGRTWPFLLPWFPRLEVGRGRGVHLLVLMLHGNTAGFSEHLESSLSSWVITLVLPPKDNLNLLWGVFAHVFFFSDSPQLSSGPYRYTLTSPDIYHSLWVSIFPFNGLKNAWCPHVTARSLSQGRASACLLLQSIGTGWIRMQ